MKLSFAIIGHNEAELLEGCLESIKDIADEIVYVDCQSSDRSIDVARKYTDKIFLKENNFNLNVNKQFAIDNCSGDWIFYIDPDERITEEVKKEIIETIKNTPYNGFLIPRKNYYFGKWLKHGGKYPDKQLRLFKKDKGRFECISIHERIKIDGKIGILKNPFEHIVIEDTKRMVDKMKSYLDRTYYDLMQVNKKRDKIIFRSIRRFFVNYFLKLGFLDGKVGFFVSLIDLLNGFLSYFKYLEFQDKNRTFRP